MPTRRALLGLAALPLLAPAAALAQAANLQSPVGLWQTIDDRTGRPRGVVRIFQAQGHLYGEIVRAFDPNEAAAVCQKCTDDRKGRPILGLQVIRGLGPDGNRWSGGTILDPETGDVYRCSMRLEDGGQKLVVRGFLGISLLGRSQTWLRAG